MENKQFIGTKELAEIYGISKQAVDKWRKNNCPHMKLSDRVFVYDLEEVNNWLSNKGSLRVIK